ncbi:uncharacterized protein [Eucyclogobius newberryi]|uniref:uncharacterized protein n=1 Tax=Eucyclogobius newberryi TaxID=166745 RepID=UPI003B5CC623
MQYSTSAEEMDGEAIFRRREGGQSKSKLWREGRRDEEEINLYSPAAAGQSGSEIQRGGQGSISSSGLSITNKTSLDKIGGQSEMRPRSRLPSKRTLLLPTIKEGTEETVRELNDANKTYSQDHPIDSSEDYFLSICHLAHPTFPARDITPYSGHARDGKLGCYGHSDPLEHLYGHPNCGLQSGRTHARSSERTRAHSIPNASTPDPTHRRKSSCPELHSTAQSADAYQRCSPKMDMTSVMEEERRDPCIKLSLISHWISDCRSAWREARSRACLLPAIAEI